MKLVRQTVLQFREGTSDKVYEIDLCELGPESYVVNFRFGRRGSKLQDGSKTPLPVSRAQADKVWDALVREKTTKGYRAADAAPPAEAAPAVTVRVEDVEDPRHRRIVAGAQIETMAGIAPRQHLLTLLGDDRHLAGNQAAPMEARRADEHRRIERPGVQPVETDQAAGMGDGEVAGAGDRDGATAAAGPG